MKTEPRFVRWKIWAKSVRHEVHTLYYAMRHSCTPWYAKAIAACVVAYALSPIDLIPDAIPVLGYLDDLVIVPLGIILVRKMISTEVLAECRQRADVYLSEARPIRWVGLLIVIAIWLATLVLFTYFLVRSFTK